MKQTLVFENDFRAKTKSTGIYIYVNIQRKCKFIFSYWKTIKLIGFEFTDVTDYDLIHPVPEPGFRILVDGKMPRSMKKRSINKFNLYTEVQAEIDKIINEEKEILHIYNSIKTTKF